MLCIAGLSVSLGDTGEPLKIGTRNDFYTRFKGKMAELLIYGRALSKTEVTAVEDYLAEVILDIYITANRPDCMSMMGIAREAHALFDAPYTPAMVRLLDPATAHVDGSPGEPSVRELLTVRIEDPAGCPRFTASTWTTPTGSAESCPAASFGSSGT